MAATEQSPWLSVEESSHAVELLAWSEDEKRKVAAVFQAVILEWALQWGITNLAPQNFQTEKFQVSPVNTVIWSLNVSEQHLMDLGINLEQNFSGDIATLIVEHALFGNTPGRKKHVDQSSVSETVAVEALTDWYSRLLKASGATGSKKNRKTSEKFLTTSQSECASWDGHMLIELPWCGATITLTLDGSTVKTILGPQTLINAQKSYPRLFDLGESLREQDFFLNLNMTGAQLSLGEIANLHLGDVVTLDHLVSDPLHLTDENGDVVFEGWLGKIQHHRAVELVEQSPHRNS